MRTADRISIFRRTCGAVFLTGIALLFCLSGCAPTGKGQKMTTTGVPTLNADIGMTIDEVRRGSTADLGKGVYYGKTEFDPKYYSFSATETFDWEAPTSNLRFAGCKYYWLQTGEQDDPHIVFMHITTAQKELTYKELAAEMLDMQTRLLKDGWQPARDAKGTTSDRAMRDSLQKTLQSPSGEAVDANSLGAGATFVRNGVVLALLGTQLDTETRAGDPRDRENFYHWVELRPRRVWEQENSSGETLP